MSSTDVLGGEFHRCLRKAEARGAQADLIDGFLTRDIDHAMALVGEGGGGLNKQGRFANARIPAKQQHRALDEAATGDPVKLVDAGGDARGGALLPR